VELDAPAIEHVGSSFLRRGRTVHPAGSRR
jgi:hypothetical protein